MFFDKISYIIIYMELILENLELDSNFPLIIFEQHYEGASTQEYTHYHNYLEISLVRRGGMRYSLTDHSFDLRENDLMILNNLEPHTVSVDERGCEIYVLCFYPELVWSGSAADMQYLEFFFSCQNNFCNYLPFEKQYASAAASLIREIFVEFTERREGFRLMIKAKLLCLLTLLYRFQPIKPISTAKKSLQKFDEVLQYLHAHYALPVRLNDCAALCNLTPQYFSTLFKETFGVPFCAYLNRLRINKSMELLQATTLPVAEVAARCGFRNLSHFHRSFAKSTGASAGRFRKR